MRSQLQQQINLLKSQQETKASKAELGALRQHVTLVQQTVSSLQSAPAALPTTDAAPVTNQSAVAADHAEEQLAQFTMWRDIQQQHDQLQSTVQSIELALAAVPLLTVPQATAVQESLSAAAGTHIELGQVRADILSQQQLCSELGGKTSQMQQQLSRIINDQPRRKLAVRTLPGTTAAQVRSALESANF